MRSGSQDALHSKKSRSKQSREGQTAHTTTAEGSGVVHVDPYAILIIHLHPSPLYSFILLPVPTTALASFLSSPLPTQTAGTRPRYP